MKRLSLAVRTLVLLVILSVPTAPEFLRLPRFVPQSIRAGLTVAWQIVQPAAFTEVD